MNREEVITVIKKSLRVAHLDEGARMGSVRGWDSMRHVRLMLDLEKAFHVKFPVDLFGTLTSVEAILAFLQTHKPLAA